jgi:hypothetical protein
MKLVRLYVSHNNRRWHEDMPYGDHLERSADIEMTGATIYHASLVEAKAPKRAKAKIVKRAY